MPILHGWRYCPRCAGVLEQGAGRVHCPACGFTGYANSTPTASALVEDDAGRVLLSLRAVEPNAGRWDLPGGYLEEGEHPLDGLRRELREETSLEIEPCELLGIWMDWYGDGPGANATLNLYWTARVTSGEPVAADDVAELHWFAPAELPGPEAIAFRNTAEVLEAWRTLRSV